MGQVSTDRGRFVARPRSLRDRRAELSVGRFLPLALGALILFSLLPVMAAGYWAVRDNTMRLLRDGRDSMLDSLEYQLRGAFDPIALQMATLARQVAVGQVSQANQGDIQRTMIGVLTGHRNVESIVYLPVEGEARRWGRAQMQEIGLSRDQIGFLPEISQMLAAGGNGGWLRPYVDPAIGGNSVAVYVQPLRRFDVSIGVLLAYVTTEAVADFMRSVNRDITPFVLSGRDRVVVHPNVPLRTPEGGGLPRLGEVGDPVLAGLWSDPEPMLLGKPEPGVTSVSMRNSDGTSSHVHLREVRGYGDRTWLIGFHQDASATMRERKVMEGLLYGSILVLLLALFAAWRIARIAAMPVTEMAAAARALEALDFAAVARPALARSRISEVRDTAHALDRAAIALARFQTYVPRALVARMVTLGEDQLQPAMADVTVLFMDLAGYSAFSEGRSAEEVSTYLNGIFALVGPIVEAHGGTIDKYTGDGLLAVWGAPTPDPDHARRAWEAALEIARKLEPVLAAGLAGDPRACRMRIGMHSGPVMAGHIGFAGRMDYTVVGRTVNIAQRTQAALKLAMGREPVALGLTAASLRAAGLDPAGFRTLPEEAGGEPVYTPVELQAMMAPSRASSDPGLAA